MNLNPIKANMTELELDGVKVLFSYRTPVAAFYPQGHAYTTSKKWSRTTAKHINQWLPMQRGFHVRNEQPQDFFDNLISEDVSPKGVK